MRLAVGISKLKDLTTHDKYLITAKYVFVGAGGRALSIYSKNQVFLEGKKSATVVSLLVVFGYVVMKIKSALAIMPKFMEKQM